MSSKRRFSRQGKSDIDKPKGKPDSRSVEARSSATELPSEPTLTVLHVSPTNNWAQWQEDNEVYFARKYGKYGKFFETMEPYKPRMPVKPKARIQAASSVTHPADTSKSSKATARSTKPAGSIRDTAAQRKPSHQESSDDEKSSIDRSDDDDDDSSASEYEYDPEDKEQELVVETEEDAIYLYRKRLDETDKQIEMWNNLKQSMYADLIRSLSSEAKAQVKTSSKYRTAKENSDPVLLLHICHKKLRHYSTARGVAKEVKSAKSLFNIHQWASEHTADYYQRFLREIEEYETFHRDHLTERMKAALFTEGLHNARYGSMKIDIENGILPQRSTLENAYKQALKRKIRNPDTTAKTTGILASSFSTTTAAPKATTRSEPQHKFPKDARKENSGESGKDKKKGKKEWKPYPCTTCKLLGITTTEHKAHECPNEKRASEMLQEATMFTSAITEISCEPGRNAIGKKTATVNMVTDKAEVTREDTVKNIPDNAVSMGPITGLLLDDELVFDTGSTINLFKNQRLISGRSKPSSLKEISTYGGDTRATREGTYKNMLTYVKPDGPANLLSPIRCKEAGGVIRYDDDTNE